MDDQWTSSLPEGEAEHYENEYDQVSHEMDLGLLGSPGVTRIGGATMEDHGIGNNLVRRRTPIPANGADRIFLRSCLISFKAGIFSWNSGLEVMERNVLQAELRGRLQHQGGGGRFTETLDLMEILRKKGCREGSLHGQLG